MVTTWAASCCEGRAGSAMVAGWPTLTCEASDSVKPTFTSMALMSDRCTKPLDVLDELLLDELLEDEAEEDCPTAPLMAATVPAIGAVSAVWLRAFWSSVTVDSAWVTAASAEATTSGSGGASLAALAAC